MRTRRPPRLCEPRGVGCMKVESQGVGSAPGLLHGARLSAVSRDLTAVECEQNGAWGTPPPRRRPNTDTTESVARPRHTPTRSWGPGGWSPNATPLRCTGPPGPHPFPSCRPRPRGKHLAPRPVVQGEIAPHPAPDRRPPRRGCGACAARSTAHGDRCLASAEVASPVSHSPGRSPGSDPLTASYAHRARGERSRGCAS